MNVCPRCEKENPADIHTCTPKEVREQYEQIVENAFNALPFENRVLSVMDQFKGVIKGLADK